MAVPTGHEKPAKTSVALVLADRSALVASLQARYHQTPRPGAACGFRSRVRPCAGTRAPWTHAGRRSAAGRAADDPGDYRLLQQHPYPCADSLCVHFQSHPVKAQSHPVCIGAVPHCQHCTADERRATGL
jgi:hypothetical protein